MTETLPQKGERGEYRGEELVLRFTYIQHELTGTQQERGVFDRENGGTLDLALYQVTFYRDLPISS